MEESIKNLFAEIEERIEKTLLREQEAIPPEAVEALQYELERAIGILARKCSLCTYKMSLLNSMQEPFESGARIKDTMNPLLDSIGSYATGLLDGCVDLHCRFYYPSETIAEGKKFHEIKDTLRTMKSCSGHMEILWNLMESIFDHFNIQ